MSKKLVYILIVVILLIFIAWLLPTYNKDSMQSEDIYSLDTGEDNTDDQPLVEPPVDDLPTDDDSDTRDLDPQTPTGDNTESNEDISSNSSKTMFWNTWLFSDEFLSEDIVTRIEPDNSYIVNLELSWFDFFGKESNVTSQAVSGGFHSVWELWVEKAFKCLEKFPDDVDKCSKVPLNTVLLLPDTRHFIIDNNICNGIEKCKAHGGTYELPMYVNLNKIYEFVIEFPTEPPDSFDITKTIDQRFAWIDNALLTTNQGAEFQANQTSFISFVIMDGNKANSIPVDEITLPLCTSGNSCTRSVGQQTNKTIPVTRESDRIHSILFINEIPDSNTQVRLFKCSAQDNWIRDDKTVSTSLLSLVAPDIAGLGKILKKDNMKKQELLNFARQLKDKVITSGGNNLLEKEITACALKESKDKTLYTRILANNSLALIPMSYVLLNNACTAENVDNTKCFLDDYFNIHYPLQNAFVRYAQPEQLDACISYHDGVFAIPNSNSADPTLKKSLASIKDNEWLNPKESHCQLPNRLCDYGQFNSWLEKDSSANKSIFALLSHNIASADEQAVRFAYDNRKPSEYFTNENFKRRFDAHPVMFLLACKSGAENAWSLINHMHKQGVQAFITSFFDLNAQMAGDFFTTLDNVISNLNNDTYIDEVLEMTLSQLSQTMLTQGKKNLFTLDTFVFFGDPDLKICKPEL